MAQGPDELRERSPQEEAEEKGPPETTPAASEETKERARQGDEVAASRAEVEQTRAEMGDLGTRTSLIPFQMVRVNDARQIIEVAADKETLKNGPTFDDVREITPEFENEVYSYYGLQRASTIEQSGTHAAHSAEQSTQTTGVADPTDMSNEDEVRVQRTEEELRVGTRERKAGSIRVRKRVRTDHERI